MSVSASERLNILYVGSMPPHPGGGAISCFQLLSGLAGAGHRVRALAPITPEALQAGKTLAPGQGGVEITLFTVPHFGGHAYAPDTDDYRERERRQIRELLPAKIAAEHPDVILARERQSTTAGIAELARSHRIPWVLLSRGGPLVSILNGTYPEALASTALAEYAKADVIVTPGKHMADGLRRRGFVNVTTIPNAVDLDQFTRGPKNRALKKELGVRDDDIVVVHAANLNRRKRPMDIIESAGRALGECPALLYVIVGDGGLRRDLEAACDRKGIRERFRFTGWIDYDRVPGYINLADLVVMPSESEGLSRVYLEAQACGRVLIASDIPAAREVVTDGDTGLLFATGDVAALTAKTLLAAGNPSLREKIGRNAFARVQMNGLREAVKRYGELLGEIVRRHRA